MADLIQAYNALVFGQIGPFSLVMNQSLGYYYDESTVNGPQTFWLYGSFTGGSTTPVMPQFPSDWVLMAGPVRTPLQSWPGITGTQIQSYYANNPTAIDVFLGNRTSLGNVVTGSRFSGELSIGNYTGPKPAQPLSFPPGPFWFGNIPNGWAVYDLGNGMYAPWNTNPVLPNGQGGWGPFPYPNRGTVGMPTGGAYTAIGGAMPWILTGAQVAQQVSGKPDPVLQYLGVMFGELIAPGIGINAPALGGTFGNVAPGLYLQWDAATNQFQAVPPGYMWIAGVGVVKTPLVPVFPTDYAALAQAMLNQ